MATIKSFSDLEQSRKLATILPIESADMCWCLATKGNPKAVFNDGYNKYGDFELPCWSLASLLGVMPKSFTYENHVYERMYNTNAMYYMNVDTYDCDMIYSNSEVLVDACYEIIIKLHELNLL